MTAGWKFQSSPGREQRCRWAAEPRLGSERSCSLPRLISAAQGLSSLGIHGKTTAAGHHWPSLRIHGSTGSSRVVFRGFSRVFLGNRHVKKHRFWIKSFNN